MSQNKEKFNKEGDTCAMCGKSVEKIDHLLLECGRIHPDIEAGTVTLHDAHGFRDNDGNVNISAIDISKKGLEDWWLKSRVRT